MSTADELIASDLAALSADSKIRIPPLVLPQPPARRAEAALPVGVETWYVVPRVYARRYARAAAGAAALGCAVALLAWLSNPLGLSTNMAMIGSDLEQYIVYLDPLEVLPWAALVVTVTYIAALRIAERRLVTGSPSDALVARARSLSGRATALRVAGTAALAITVAMAAFANGLDSYCAFWATGDLSLAPAHILIVAGVLGTLVVSLAVGALAALAPRRAWADRAARRLAHPAVTVAGVVLGFATVVTGARLDVGPRFAAFVQNATPSLGLRITLTITGSLAVWLVVASTALRRDRREQRALDQSPAPGL